MGRKSRKRPYHEEHRPLDVSRALGGMRFEETHDGLTYKVQSIRSGAKDYRCPGCQQIIPAGTGHVVAWTEDGWMGAAAGQEARRHWHRSCWDHRDRRGYHL